VKNYTTPRTLAQCEFVTGYSSVSVRKRRTVDVLFTVVLFACAGIGAFLYLAR
jgi:hypothetical protein